MTQDDILEHIRSLHSKCCVTQSTGERGCRLNLRGFDSASLVMLDGSRYQRQHRFRQRLCDRIAFGLWQGMSFTCAVELKRGRNLDIGEALEQIQNGLSVAADSLSEHTVDSWYPILLFGGRLNSAGTTKLRTRPVSFQRRRREYAEVIKRDCGDFLTNILDESSPVN